MLYPAMKAGATSQTIDVWLADSSSTTGAGLTGLAFNTASLVAYYRRGATGSATAITLATQTVGGAYSSGGFVEISSANQPGAYRLDLPDAAVAAGVPYVTVELKGATNLAPAFIVIPLVAYDPQDAVRLGLTSLPNVAAGGDGGLATAFSAVGEVYFRKYGVLLVTGTTAIELPIEKVGGGLAGSGDWTPAAGDVQVSIAGGALANATNLPTYNNGWEWIATAAELTGKNIRVFIKDQGTKVIRDMMFTVETFGHASAMYPDDWTASSGVAQTGDSFARLGAPVGASISADIAGVQADTDNIQTRLPAALVSGRMDSSIGAVANGVIAAASFAANALDAVWSTATRTLSSAGVQAIWDALTTALTTVGSIGKRLADDIDATISSRSSHTAADVWAAGTRTLTAGTNIVLAKGTGITGLNDIAAADVWASVTRTLTGNQGIKKNTALAAFAFLMTDSTNHAPATGLTVTAQRSLDGAAFGACANAVTEIGSGWYKIDLAAGDLNGTTVALKFTATGADAQNIAIVTAP